MTNNEITKMMQQDLQESIRQSARSHQQQLMNDVFIDNVTSNMMSGLLPHKKRIRVHTRAIAPTSWSRIVSYPGGYWAKVVVNDNDHVTYKLFKSGWIARVFHKIGFRKVLDNGWDSVKQRESVEATLGATYMEIEEAIAEDQRKQEHGKFLEEMIKTDPDNLKAIAQLDMLDKGDGPGTEDGPATSSKASASPGTVRYKNNLMITGTGGLTIKDPNKPASLSVGPSALNTSPGGTITFSGKHAPLIEESPEGKISFGNEMAKAIKEAAQQPEKQGETDGS